jgi:hypothetical protein
MKTSSSSIAAPRWRRRRQLWLIERQALGVPVIPPGRVGAWMTGLRRLILGAHRQSAPPPVQVLETLFASFDTHVLRAMIELGIPGVLTRPIPISELALLTGSDPSRLERLVRYAATRRFVAIDRHGRVRPSGVTKALRADTVGSWRGWVEFAGSDWFDAAWRQLAASMAPGSKIAFELAHDAPFFEYTTSVDPEAGETFDEAMKAGATLQGIALARSLPWSDTTSVCDVGGGSGAALDIIQRYHPHLEATLFDLPDVVARSRFGDGSGFRRRRVVGGSFFDALPPEHDRFLLLAIVHDWDDASAIAILDNVRDAMGQNGQAVVVENVAAERPRNDFAAASDLLMFVLATGRERTKEEYGALFDRARLSVAEEHLLATGATAFVLQTSSG